MITEQKLRLADVIAEFLTHILARGLSDNTHRTYAQDLAVFLDYVGNRYVVDIASRDIDLFHQYLREYVSPRTGRGLSLHTIQKYIKTIKVFFSMCVDRGYIAQHPARHIHLRRLQVDLDKKTIPPSDLQRMLDHASRKRRNRERDVFIITALADFGPRRAELAGLRVRNVDAVNRTVTLKRKGGRTQVVPVSEEFVRAYQAWMAVRPDVDHDYVLLSTSDSVHPPLTPEALAQAFRRIAKRATGRGWGPHAVRHTWISEALNNAGIPPKVVQDIAGHQRLDTTVRYARPDLEAQRRAIEQNPILAATSTPTSTLPHDNTVISDANIEFTYENDEEFKS